MQILKSFKCPACGNSWTTDGIQKTCLVCDTRGKFLSKIEVDELNTDFDFNEGDLANGKSN